MYEEAGRQRWVATGLSDRAAAEQLIVKERKKQERVRAGLAPATESRELSGMVGVIAYFTTEGQPPLRIPFPAR
ncbi:MAG TPA: hypothetical protein VKX17_09465 [Planctomycetota bacterium]|nr:hypothetical protein [Planctomycetota bacterium]